MAPWNKNRWSMFFDFFAHEIPFPRTLQSIPAFFSLIQPEVSQGETFFSQTSKAQNTSHLQKEKHSPSQSFAIGLLDCRSFVFCGLFISWTNNSFRRVDLSTWCSTASAYKEAGEATQRNQNPISKLSCSFNLKTPQNRELGQNRSKRQKPNTFFWVKRRGSFLIFKHFQRKMRLVSWRPVARHSFRNVILGKKCIWLYDFSFI